MIEKRRYMDNTLNALSFFRRLTDLNHPRYGRIGEGHKYRFNKYMPHQGEKEKKRRLKQIANGHLKIANGLRE